MKRTLVFLLSLLPLLCLSCSIDTRQAYWEEDVVIKGIVGNTIESKTLHLSVTNDSFLAIENGADISSWVKDVPADITITCATAVVKGATRLTLLVSGTAKAVDNATFSLTIPASALSSGNRLYVNGTEHSVT